MRTKTFHEERNPDNNWQYIKYRGGESGEFIVTVQGRYIGQFYSLSAAQRARDEALNGPPDPPPAPLTPSLYYDHEVYS